MENQGKDGMWELSVLATCGWIRRIYPVLEFIEKKWKVGLKIGYGNLGSIPFGGWMLRIYPVFLEFTDQMENRGKDGIWELSILLSLAGWTRRIYPVYLEFDEKKALKIGLKIGYDNLGSIPFEGWILRFYPVIL